jgi:putative transposase
MRPLEVQSAGAGMAARLGALGVIGLDWAELDNSSLFKMIPRSGSRSHSHRPTQLSLSLAVPSTWGGPRRGAGRKRAATRPLTPHRARPPHSACHPVVVTLRGLFRPLRSQHVLPTLRLAIRGACRRDPMRFRVTHFTVQYDHVHLIVEASNRAELSSGMRSLTIRIARSVNTLVRRRGRFWADRWHGRELGSPREVRTALLYVLANFRKHARRELGPGIDPFSSGMWFDGWRLGPESAAGLGAERAPPSGEDGRGAERDPQDDSPQDDSLPVMRPGTWLGRAGWQSRGLLRLDESPRRASKRG